MLANLHLAHWEWFRLRRRTGFLVLAALALLIPTALMVFAVVQNVWAVVLDVELGYSYLTAAGLSTVTPWLAIILASQLFAVDLQAGNSRTLVGRGAHRGIIPLAKATVAGLILLTFHLLAYAAAVFPALLFQPHFEGWANALADAGTSLLNGLLYLSLGIALSHWRASAAFTIGVGIAVIVVESFAYPIAGVIGEQIDWPISEIAAWTIWGVTRGLQGEAHEIARPWFAPIVAAYAAALVALSVALFMRTDLKTT